MSNHSKYINFLNENKVVCSPHEFIYVTTELSTHDTLILICEILEKENIECTTRFKFSDIKS